MQIFQLVSTSVAVIVSSLYEYVCSGKDHVRTLPVLSAVKSSSHTGAPSHRGVPSLQYEKRRMYGSPLQACKHPAHRHINSVEGAGKGEQGVLRGLQRAEERIARSSREVCFCFS
ncbi:hypothetical protein SAY86_014607 [Trapa natans]|uniref:Uncharacterized protein n=1 Tax=Trapa natans TaxID=22666 RepID=A0AAN7KGT6_TRANT|nr:hypothetical protein SAY86_014607 [Trapa natans]